VLVGHSIGGMVVRLYATTYPDQVSGMVLVAVAQAKAQARLAALVPGAVHVTETRSGHDIHLIQPQLVVDAVRDVVAAGRTAQEPS
jgi:pimeloyl-ACP methyl ester carboxylesterase